jgi:hypothetical protein
MAARFKEGTKFVCYKNVLKYFLYMYSNYIFGKTSGLPDGIFPHQNSQFGCILESLGIENVSITIWNI